MTNQHNDAAPWEEQLRQGLDTLADLGAEEPPNLADLQMLVVQVQREQRQQLLRDLSLFWLCGLTVLAVVFYLISRSPAYFVAIQGLALVGLAATGAGFLRSRKRVTE